MVPECIHCIYMIRDTVSTDMQNLVRGSTVWFAGKNGVWPLISNVYLPRSVSGHFVYLKRAVDIIFIRVKKNAISGSAPRWEEMIGRVGRQLIYPCRIKVDPIERHFPDLPVIAKGNPFSIWGPSRLLEFERCHSAQIASITVNEPESVGISKIRVVMRRGAISVGDHAYPLQGDVIEAQHGAIR